MQSRRIGPNHADLALKQTNKQNKQTNKKTLSAENDYRYTERHIQMKKTSEWVTVLDKHTWTWEREKKEYSQL